MEKATEDMEKANFIVSRLIGDFQESASELCVKYGDIDSISVYTALSVMLCQLAIKDGMSAHTLMECLLATYRGLEGEEK